MEASEAVSLILRIGSADVDPPRFVTVREWPAVIGRAEGLAVRIDDPRCSREHVRLEVRGGAVWAVDLGSSNGFRRRGERMREARLRVGDEIVVAGTSLTIVQLDLPEPAAPRETDHASSEARTARAGVRTRSTAMPVAGVQRRRLLTRWLPPLTVVGVVVAGAVVLIRPDVSSEAPPEPPALIEARQELAALEARAAAGALVTPGGPDALADPELLAAATALYRRTRELSDGQGRDPFTLFLRRLQQQQSFVVRAELFRVAQEVTAQLDASQFGAALARVERARVAPDLGVREAVEFLTELEEECSARAARAASQWLDDLVYLEDMGAVDEAKRRLEAGLVAFAGTVHESALRKHAAGTPAAGGDPQALMEHMPGKHTPGKHAPAEQGPGKHAPAEQAPGEQAPGEQAPSEQAGQGGSSQEQSGWESAFERTGHERLAALQALFVTLTAPRARGAYPPSVVEIDAVFTEAAELIERTGVRPPARLALRALTVSQLAALRASFTESLVRELGPAVQQLRGEREELDRRRTAALTVIYDAAIYLPEDHPDWPRGDVINGQRQVDERVAAVRELWDATPTRVLRVPGAAQGLLERVRHLDARWAPELRADRPVDPVALGDLLRNDAPELTIRNFALDDADRRRLVWDQQVQQYNADFRHADLNDRDREHIAFVNDHRALMGRARCFIDIRLCRATRAHSQACDRAGRIWHDGPNGTPQSRAQAQGFTDGVSENVALGYGNPRDIWTRGWYRASDHHRVALAEHANCMGYGYVGSVGTQNFARARPPFESGSPP